MSKRHGSSFEQSSIESHIVDLLIINTFIFSTIHHVVFPVHCNKHMEIRNAKAKYIQSHSIMKHIDTLTPYTICLRPRPSNIRHYYISKIPKSRWRQKLWGKYVAQMNRMCFVGVSMALVAISSCFFFCSPSGVLVRQTASILIMMHLSHNLKYTWKLLK